MSSCNIYKDDRIPKFDYYDGFKNFKIDNFCLKVQAQNSAKEIKSKQGRRFEPATHRLLFACPLTDYLREELTSYEQIKTIIFIVYFERKYVVVYKMEVSYSPLMLILFAHISYNQHTL